MEELPKERGEIFYGTLIAYGEATNYISLILDKHHNDNNEVLQNIFNILKYISERSATVNFLLQSNLLWDAEIIMRTVQEATIKIVFLTEGNDEDRVQKLNEYKDELAEINYLKMSELAKSLVQLFEKDDDKGLAFKPLILDIDKEKELKEKWSGKRKRDIESKWSFTNIVREQANKNPLIKETLHALIHYYRISSNLIHADENGVGIVAERSLRSEEDVYTVELAHFCRLVYDLFQYLIISGLCICKLLKENPLPLINLQKTLTSLHIKSDKYYSDIFKDDNSYNKYRN